MLLLCFVAGFVSATIWVLRESGLVCVHVKFCEADCEESSFIERASQRFDCREERQWGFLVLFDGVGVGSFGCSDSGRGDHSHSPHSSRNTRFTKGVDRRCENQSTAAAGRRSVCAFLAAGDLLEVRTPAGVQRSDLQRGGTRSSLQIRLQEPAQWDSGPGCSPPLLGTVSCYCDAGVLGTRQQPAQESQTLRVKSFRVHEVFFFFCCCCSSFPVTL